MNININEIETEEYSNWNINLNDSWGFACCFCN